MLQQEQTEYDEHGMQTHVGQVKMCISGTYREICDVGWDNQDVQVLCNLKFGRDYGKLFINERKSILVLDVK